MTLDIPRPLRVSAIKFLNPAPLMWDFEHPPRKQLLDARYEVRYTNPALCADDLLANRADLGLIPIAALTPELAIVRGCTIASLDKVRSIQLIIKRNGGPSDSPEAQLARVTSVAADTASRSSLAYAQILFSKFLQTEPHFLSAPADPVAMLAVADAALLIGDPALLALESREHIEQAAGPCLWIDLAHEWVTRTGLPWVAAVWAVRPESVIDPDALTADLQTSRDNGLAHVDALVHEWAPRIAVPPLTIRHYLTHNIQYFLSQDCIRAVETFRRYAAEAGILPPLSQLRFL